MPNVSLTPELDRFAEHCVATGRYSTVSEVMRAALRLLQAQEDRRLGIQRMLERAERDSETHGFIDADQMDAELRAIIATV